MTLDEKLEDCAVLEPLMVFFTVSFISVNPTFVNAILFLFFYKYYYPNAIDNAIMSALIVFNSVATDELKAEMELILISPTDT